jgi:hypothetical protein
MIFFLFVSILLQVGQVSATYERFQMHAAKLQDSAMAGRLTVHQSTALSAMDGQGSGTPEPLRNSSFSAQGNVRWRSLQPRFAPGGEHTV